jgi:Ca-activated chloride channel family protein
MNFAEFHFLRPWWLLALLPTLLILVWLVKNRQSRGNWSEVCDAELLPFLLADQPRKQRGGLLAGAVAAVLTIVALAGPTWQRLPSPAFRNESALVIALNLSASMDAADIKPSRLAKARYKIADLLKQRKDGQTALLVYGGDAFTVTPLTSDVATISSQLEALTTDIMPSPGVNTSNALRKAANLLRQAGAAQGHILLVTDSVDDDSAALADKWLGSYRLSVLAIGTADGAPIKQTGGGFVKDQNGGIIVARLDTQVLSELAHKGKGIYQAVTPGDEDVETLGKLFNHLAEGDKAEDSNLLLQQWDEKGPWLVLLVLPWAALRFRKGLLIWAGLLLLPFPRDSQALDWQSLWRNSDQQAVQAFNQQQYSQAAERFADADWRAAAQYRAGQYAQAAETLKNTQSADGFYNRGNALAQAGQLQEALQAYQQALTRQPGHADAEFNKQLVEKKLQEQQQQQQQQQNQQKQDKGQDKKDSQQQQQGGEDNKENQQDQQQKSKPQQHDDSNRQQAEAQDKQEQQQPKADESGKPQQQDDKEQSKQQHPSAADTEKAEIDRANEQLLKRIPDEPTGLLKRKFKYQYSQHQTAP